METTTAKIMTRHGATLVICAHLPGGYCETCPIEHLMLVVAPTQVWQFTDARSLKAAADENYRATVGSDPRARLMAALAR